MTDDVTLDGVALRVTGVSEMSKTATNRKEPVDNGVPIVRALPHFETFYEIEFEAVIGLAYSLSGSRLGSEGLAQEAFLAA